MALKEPVVVLLIEDCAFPLRLLLLMVTPGSDPTLSLFLMTTIPDVAAEMPLPVMILFSKSTPLTVALARGRTRTPPPSVIPGFVALFVITELRSVILL